MPLAGVHERRDGRHHTCDDDAGGQPRPAVGSHRELEQRQHDGKRGRADLAGDDDVERAACDRPADNEWQRAAPEQQREAGDDGEDDVNEAHRRRLPVPRHDLVVDIGDRIMFVQQRLHKGSSRRLTRARVDAIVEINDRFANALTDRPDVPPATRWFDRTSAESSRLSDLIVEHDPRARDVLGEIVRLTTTSHDGIPTGTDLVHVDLSPANVLFDENDSATAVVDWNLGAYRGDRLLALVQTRFDREWFVRSPNADSVETDAAHHLDEILVDRIQPERLRIYWAYWLRHHLHKAIRHGSPTAIDWHLRMAESRLL